MTENLQPGHHLSADQLSAFAENVLPEHERVAALTHLAGCAECRQVVYLTQQADPTLLAPTPAAEVPRSGWFTLPQIFGAATAALVCSLILALILHQRHTEPMGTPPVATAKLEPQPALVPTEPIPTPAAPVASLAQISPRAARSTPVAPVVVPKPEPQPMPASAPHTVGSGNYSGGMTMGRAESTKSDKVYFGDNSTVSANTYAALPPKAPSGAALPPPPPSPPPPPPPPPPVSRLRESAPGSALSGKGIATDAMAAAPAPAPVSSNMIAGAKTDEISTASYQDLPMMGRNITNAAKAKAAAPAPLPSKRAAANVLQASGRMLALDTAGALFVSLDLGKHWTPVAAQWPGKAVLISYAPTPTRLYLQQPSQNQMQNQNSNTSNGSVGNSAPTQQQSTIPAAGFDLTTATGAVWHSTDGFTWHAR